ANGEQGPEKQGLGTGGPEEGPGAGGQGPEEHSRLGQLRSRCPDSCRSALLARALALRAAAPAQVAPQSVALLPAGRAAAPQTPALPLAPGPRPPAPAQGPRPRSPDLSQKSSLADCLPQTPAFPLAPSLGSARLRNRYRPAAGRPL